MLLRKRWIFINYGFDLLMGLFFSVAIFILFNPAKILLGPEISASYESIQ